MLPLRCDQSHPNVLKIISAVLVQCDGSQCHRGMAGGEVTHRLNCDLGPVFVTVTLTALNLDKSKQKPSVRAGNGLNIESCASKLEPVGVK